jgi:hypothetical protein
MEVFIFVVERRTQFYVSRYDVPTVFSREYTFVIFRKLYVWFSTRSITNIIDLCNLIQQYRVTYDSDNKIFVVHQESQGKPNMEFRMHKCGLNYYDPRNKKHLAFVNTVSENKEGFTKRHIKGAELA